jgi:HEAT repeat protein
MGKRVKIALVVLAVALLGVIARQLAQPPDEPEPVYQGKKLSEWMTAVPVYAGITGSGRNELALRNAMAAVRQTGTNAIPTLLRMLRAKDSLWKVRLMALAQRQHLIKVQHTPAIGWNVAGYWGLAILGANAQSAAPELIKIVDENISLDSQLAAIRALVLVGPSAKEAAPSLLRWSTNSNSSVSINAMEALLKIDPEAAAKAGITDHVP